MDKEDKEQIHETCQQLISKIKGIIMEHFLPDAPLDDFIRGIDEYAQFQVFNALYQKQKKRRNIELNLQDRKRQRNSLAGDSDCILDSDNCQSSETESIAEDMEDQYIEEEEDMSARFAIREISPAREKILCILALGMKVPVFGCYEDDPWRLIREGALVRSSHLSLGAYAFARTTIRPIMKCLVNHFGGDVDKFAERWSDCGGYFSTGSFYKKCCGDICKSEMKDRRLAFGFPPIP